MGRTRYIVGISGASGALYGRRLLEVLAGTGSEIRLVVTEAAAKVIEHELALPIDLADGPSVIRTLLGHEPSNVLYHHNREIEAPISSGSFQTKGMVICPCSGGTMGRIASGSSSSLIERAADVCLKERRPLILVPRETPLSLIHLRNMTTLTEAGATIVPASPGFYSKSDSVDRLVDFMVSRILDQLGVENTLMARWGEPARKRHPED